MIGHIWLGEASKLIMLRFPIKVTAIHDHTTHLYTMSIHILGGRVCDDIRSELKRTAVDRRRDRIIYNQWYSMLVRDTCYALNVQDTYIRVGKRLTKNEFGIWTESSRPLLITSILINKSNLDTHLREGYAKEVIGTTIDTCGGDHVITRLTDIKARKKVGCLTRRSQHTSHATFHRSNLCSRGIIGGVLKTSIKIARIFKVKETTHLLARLILKCGTLNDRHLTWLTLTWVVACLHAKRVNMQLLGHCVDSTLILSLCNASITSRTSVSLNPYCFACARHCFFTC